MRNNSSNNKRIAKNTLMLYLRMFLTLGIGLYTVRIVLKVLGVVDYGIYNVVGGSVAAFVFLSNTLSSATQRFFSFCLGRDDIGAFNKYFENFSYCFIILSLLTFVILETFGLCFFDVLVIPEERTEAALWVFQSALVSLILSFLRVPYRAVVISYERMEIFAYTSIFEAVMKLCMAFGVSLIPFDSLKVYAFLYALVDCCLFLIYKHYAHRIHLGLRMTFRYDKECIKELLGFTSWNFIGATSGLVRGQGLNILINIYFGPVFNTARGIAYQIHQGVNGFASNFMTAVNPQIIKLYAANEKAELEKLVTRSSKLSFILLTLFSFPLIVLMPYILDLWLGDVPATTVLFSRLVLVNMLVECLSHPLMTLAQATGKLMAYQSTVGGLLILNLPLSWISFGYFHADAYVCFVILIILSIVSLFCRLLILKHTANLHIWRFIKEVILKWGLLMAFCYMIFLIIVNTELLSKIFISLAMSLFVIPVFVFCIVLNHGERQGIKKIVTQKIRR